MLQNEEATLFHLDSFHFFFSNYEAKLTKERNNCLFFFFRSFFRATPAAHGGSQARGSNQSYSCQPIPEPLQHQILNPLGKARDQTRNLIVPSQICFHCTTTGTPRKK